jgi:stearoyl-CoA desaturase (Delta-9 desaturase)
MSITAPNSGAASKPYAPLSRSGRRQQRLHAAAVLILPAGAAAVGGWELLQGTVERWELALLAASYVVTMIGMTVGFHRMLSHRAFESPNLVRAVLAILGSMTAQGPPIYWVSNHRRHHRFSDAVGDPHSPHCQEEHQLGRWSGLWHAHIGWTFTHAMSSSTVFCRDLLRDRTIGWVNRHYRKWVLLGLALPAAIGALIEGSPQGAWHGLVWGGGIRLFASYHSTSAINSVAHVFGYRTFDTGDTSRNNFWLGLITLGETWHNNHHAAPGSAIFGFSWWETDIGGMVIVGLERLGLAWHVRRPSALALERQRLRPARTVPSPVSGESAEAKVVIGRPAETVTGTSPQAVAPSRPSTS